MARDPILSQEITNGHAARMRYSRFKKQMDGTATKPRARGPNSPRKQRVEKKPRKSKGKGNDAKAESEDEDDERVKPEPGMRHGTVESDRVSAADGGRMQKRVKLEPGVGVASSSGTPRTMPGTPGSSNRYLREVSASPSPGPSERFDAGDMSDMGEMGFSFGIPGEEAGIPGMYDAPMMNEGMGGGFGMGMPLQIGFGEPFEGLWQGGAHAHAPAHGRGYGGPGGSGLHHESVMVKTEPRWEEAYRHG